MSRTAVVILNYNGEKFLRQFLPSVIQFSPQAEVIVADNGSTDQSMNILQNEFPGVTRIPFERNYGFCGGYNRALSQVNADYFVLLNSDVEVSENWLAPLIKILDEHPAIEAVQPKILSWSNKTVFEYAGAGGGLIDALGYPFCRGRLFTHVETDAGQYNDDREIFWATGACLMIRSEVYKKYGGLDEDFFAHMEEIDLCWKINRGGGKIAYCGRSTVYHVGAGTLGYASPRKTYLNFRNGLTMVFKHFNTGEMFYKFPLRLALDWLAALVFLVKGEIRNTGAVFQAHFAFIQLLGKNMKKRGAIRKLYPEYSKQNVYPGSIIFEFYVRGKRKIDQ